MVEALPLVNGHVKAVCNTCHAKQGLNCNDSLIERLPYECPKPRLHPVAKSPEIILKQQFKNMGR